MIVNDDAGFLMPGGGFKFFASKLAPTGEFFCEFILCANYLRDTFISPLT